MSKSVVIYAAILVLGLGASWARYTSDETEPKEGVVLVESKKGGLQSVKYDSPDLDVTFEARQDDFGKYWWGSVAEQKKKKVDGQEQVSLEERKFKVGSAADKLVESLEPLMALRELKSVDDAKLESYGLKAPDTTVTITDGGGTATLEIGGETYGTKDRYVRHRETGRIFVVKDEAFKTLKFANTRLPEKQLVAAKKAEIEKLTLGTGGQSVSYTQKNRDDAAATYWEKDGGTGKDETFSNWLEKFLKVKATAYAADGDVPADALAAFDLTVVATDKKPETVRFLQAGDDWFATSESLRGTVKLPRSSAKDVADDVKDVIEGRAPPEEPKAPKKPGEPAADDHGGEDGDDHGMSGGRPPRPGPPGLPGMPRPMMPGAPKKE